MGVERLCCGIRSGEFDFAKGVPPTHEDGKWVYYINEEKLMKYLDDWGNVND